MICVRCCTTGTRVHGGRQRVPLPCHKQHLSGYSKKAQKYLTFQSTCQKTIQWVHRARSLDAVDANSNLLTARDGPTLPHSFCLLYFSTSLVN